MMSRLHSLLMDMVKSELGIDKEVPFSLNINSRVPLHFIK